MKQEAGTLYRVVDWNRVHENHESRKLKRELQWIYIPTNHDTCGYRRLMMESDGTALYGAYHQILTVAAKCSPRGALLRGNGEPHTAASIALTVGGDANLIQRCLDILQNPDIGWIAADAGRSREIAADAGRSREIAADAGRSREIAADAGPDARAARTRVPSLPFPSLPVPKEERTDIETVSSTAIGESAQRMYALHPKKRDLALLVPALENVVGGKGDLQAMLVEIESCHAAWCQSPEWTKDNGRFTPKLALWIDDLGFTKWPPGSKQSKKIIRTYTPPTRPESPDGTT